ncbi:MAG TPA: archaemetzincin family Zn-dependent metalloprotease [Thermoanaerobaculia bacterium]|nr:archaemetzincin family Zn-dependent metalloprotease [Thermoanaerobaculia bacterium]
MKSGVSLWWIGGGPGDPVLLEGVTRVVTAEFGLPVRAHGSPERPVEAWDPRRGQHASGKILSWLDGKTPAAAGRVLGVTDADLFIPILTFVFGEAQLHGRAAVVSTARLSGLDGVPAPPGVLLARLEKECVHELGHTFGLVHCRAAGCAMARSASLRDVDAKTPHLCGECRERIHNHLREEHSHESQEHPHPDRR